MIRPFVDFLFPAIPAEFRSRYDMTTSVERLRAATFRSVFRAGFQQAAVGTVTQDQVRLSRLIPLVGNNLKPHFIGSFRHEGSGVVLTGEFATPTWSKIGTMIPMGFFAVMEVLVLLGTLLGRAAVWWAPFPCVGLFAFGVAITKLNQWFARNDAAWISRVIEQALVSPDNSADLEDASPRDR